MSSTPSESELTEAQLMAMSTEELEAYAARISTSIGLEQSTIDAYELTQAEYELSILKTQSSITGLDTEINVNTAQLNAAILAEQTFAKESAELDSTIQVYSLAIAEQDTILSLTDSTIAGLTLESAKIEADLKASDAAFVSSATSYSSLYIVYLAKETAYQKRLEDIALASTQLSQAEMEEAALLENYRVSSQTRQVLDKELGDLYAQSNVIAKELSDAIQAETTAIANLNSTNSALITLNSLYETSLINQKYYQLISTQSSKIEQYASALNTFNAADSAYRVNPTNTTLLTARNMAEKQLVKISSEKDEVTSQVTSLQALVNDAMDGSYETLLMQYQADITMEDSNISTFTQYRSQAESSISGYSSLYEAAILDITSSLNGIKQISSFYESSLAGAATLLASAQADSNLIAPQEAAIATLDILITSYTKDYENYTSSYDGYISVSSVMRAKRQKAIEDLVIISSFYESTSLAVGKLTDELSQVNSSITGYTTILSLQSNILMVEDVNIQDYDIQVKDAFNMQEKAMFQYRETYARQKRMTLQNLYDAKVIQAVQATSTLNGTNQAAAGPGVTIVPQPVNLASPDLTDTLGKVNTINAFIDTFNTIYSLYDTQAANYQQISTTVGTKKIGVQKILALQNQLVLTPTNTQAKEELNAVQTAVANLDSDYNSKMNNVNLTQNQIDTNRQTFLTSYTTIFRADEILAQESTISSFMIQGFNAAVTI